VYHDPGHHGKPHESPPVMWVPLAILALLSLIGGWIGWPASMGGSNHFEHFLEPAIARVEGESHGASRMIPSNQIAAGGVPRQSTPPPAHPASGDSISTERPATDASQGAIAKAEENHDNSAELTLTAISVILGLLGIGIGWLLFLRNPLRQMPQLLENKYYVDELYETVIINPIEQTSRHFLWKIVDVKIIDGIVNGVAKGFAVIADTLRYTQSGFARSYAAVILLGAIVVIGYFGYIAMH
jgi:NADH-quinone oxidoreductase subunit L